ncbi:MAG: enoyl-CoA hydratase/isomerase family protein [Thiohalocapsa sp.]
MANSVLQERAGEVVILTLNRPERGNALDPLTVEALMSAIERAPAAGAGLIVIGGEGRHFCTGFDLTGIDSATDGDLLLRFVRIERLLQLVYQSPVPVMALAKGRVVGAGADLFCAAMHRIAAPEASFRMPGWRFGLALGTRRLADRVGNDIARLLLLEDRTFDAPLARTIGFATDIAPEPGWPAAIAAASGANALSPEAASALLGLTFPRHGEADMAALVETAGRPGLRQRILAYRDAAKG